MEARRQKRLGPAPIASFEKSFEDNATTNAQQQQQEQKQQHQHGGQAAVSPLAYFAQLTAVTYSEHSKKNKLYGYMS